MPKFRDDERGFRRWINLHSRPKRNGYVLNCYKAPAPNGKPYMLHEAACHTLTTANPRTGRNFTTGLFYKKCSTTLHELLDWAAEIPEAQIERCQRCLLPKVPARLRDWDNPSPQ
jgi:hypothetical protein